MSSEDSISWSRQASAWLMKVLVAGSVVAILLLTLTPDGRKRGVLHPWPLQDLRSLFTHDPTPQMVALQLGGNVALFIPLGFFVPLAFPAFDELARTVLLGCGLSIFIETTQYILPIGRTASLDDVLLNTAGTLGGFLLMRAVRHVLSRRWAIEL